MFIAQRNQAVAHSSGVPCVASTDDPCFPEPSTKTALYLTLLRCGNWWWLIAINMPLLRSEEIDFCKRFFSLSSSLQTGVPVGDNDKLKHIGHQHFTEFT